MSIQFANRTEQMKASEIRESYKLMDIPGMISLSSGSPDPSLYPMDQVKQATMAVLDQYGTTALSYSATDGYDPLREKIAQRMWTKAQVRCSMENILIMSGSQQALEFSAKIFINEGDYIACETPSYMDAFNAFAPYLPKYASVPTDEFGMLPEELDKILAENKKVKMIYVIPNFQNPTGHTWSLERRKAFMEVVNKYEIPVIEDDPYGELRYEGEALPSLKSMDTKNLVIYAGSFSKILAPGYRVAWICAAPEIVEKYMFAKQGADLQAPSSAQLEVDMFMEMFDLDEHVKKICAAYKHKRDVMLQMMEENFPDCVTWNKPEGGLFIWVTLPEGINSKDILKVCLENRVMFVTGSMFYPNGGVENTFRLNFSWMNEEDIKEGIRRMGVAIKQALEMLQQK